MSTDLNQSRPWTNRLFFLNSQDTKKNYEPSRTTSGQTTHWNHSRRPQWRWPGSRDESSGRQQDTEYGNTCGLWVDTRSFALQETFCARRIQLLTSQKQRPVHRAQHQRG